MLPCGLLFIFSFALLLFLLCPDIHWFDSAEFVWATHRLDLAHPPGHPLYTAIAKLFTWLPFGAIAYRLNLFSAFCVAASITIFGLLLLQKRQGVDRRIAWLAAALLPLACLHPSVALQAMRTEVYALHLFFATLIVAMLLLELERHHQARLPCFVAGCFLLGVALTNQLLLAGLLVPVLMVFAFVPLRKECITAKIAWGTLFGLFGCLVYLYLPLRAQTFAGTAWGDPTSIERFVNVLLAKDFQIFFQAPLTRIGSFVEGVEVIGAATFLLGVIAIGYLWMKCRAASLLLLLSLSFSLLAAPIKDFYLENPDSHAYIAFPLLLLWFSIYYAITQMKWATLKRPVLYSLMVPALAFGLTGARHHQPTCCDDHRLAEALTHDMFMNLPYQSTVALSSDHFVFPAMYYQDVEHLRPDVAFFSPLLWQAGWYRQATNERYPWLFDAKQSIDKPWHQVMRPKQLFAEGHELLNEPKIWGDLYCENCEGRQLETAFDYEYKGNKQRYQATGRYIHALREERRGNYYLANNEPWLAIVAYNNALDCCLDDRLRAQMENKKNRWRSLSSGQVPTLFPRIKEERRWMFDQEIEQWLKLGDIYLSFQLFDRAKKAYDQAWKIGKSPNALIGRAEVYFQQGNSGRAINVLSQGDQANAAPFMTALGVIHLMNGKAAEAAKQFERALKVAEPPEQALYYMAMLDTERGELDRSVANLQRLVKLNPNSTPGWLLLAKIYEMQGKHDEARKALQRAPDEKKEADANGK